MNADEVRDLDHLILLVKAAIRPLDAVGPTQHEQDLKRLRDAFDQVALDQLRGSIAARQYAIASGDTP